MYALIYDEHNLQKPLKKVISVHNNRQDANDAPEKRKKTLGKKVWECNTRIVWTEKEVAGGDLVGPAEYGAWRPGEAIPEGEIRADSD
jgi:hypothetical protein